MDIYNKKDSKEWIEPIVIFTTLLTFLILFIIEFQNRGSFGGILGISASVIMRLTNYLMIRSND